MPWVANTKYAMPCRQAPRFRIFLKLRVGPMPSTPFCWWAISLGWGLSLPSYWKCQQQLAPFGKARSGGCATEFGKMWPIQFCWLSPLPNVCEIAQDLAGRPVLMVGTLAKAFLNDVSVMLASACRPARISSLFLISTLRPKARFFISPICKSSILGMVKLSRTTLTFLSFRGLAVAVPVALTTSF